jgi:hypothetical protein
MFKVLHALAGTLGFPSLTIQAVGMDHSYSIRNAAIETGGAEGVVDCSIHVDRGIMKNRDKLQNPENLDTVRSHFRMLVRITNREIFDRGVAVVLADWRDNLNEDVFAAWFEDIYLNDDWGNGSFHAGAGGVPGIASHNQCDESLFRSIKRIIRTKATVEHFWERSVPELLQHESLHFAHDIVNRGAENQLARVQTGHIHRDILEKAMMYLNHADKNILMVCTSVLMLCCINTNVCVINCHR